jgi:molecular chaperone GrpE (heat shock protein)
MMDIKAGEEHVRSEARDWRERALKAQAEIDNLKHVLLADAENERLEVHKEQCFDRMRTMQDEIERLRAWKDEHSRTEGGECPYCEIDRLRAVLEQIANSTVLRAREIAREALREVDS